MTIYSSFTGTSKQAIWSASSLTLLMWFKYSSSSSILHVENLRWMKRILNKLSILWMLSRVLYASVGPWQLLMWKSWLSAKLKPMMDIIFLMRLWYSFNLELHWKVKFPHIRLQYPKDPWNPTPSTFWTSKG